MMDPTNTPPPARRRWQFGLRTLFLATAAAPVIFAALTGFFGPIPQAIIGAIFGFFVVIVVHILAAAAILLPVALTLVGIRYVGTLLLKRFHTER